MVVGIIPVELPIQHTVPHAELLRGLLNDGVLCAGGFPLWLINGASHYNDIDLYAINWEMYYRVHALLRNTGRIVLYTKETTIFGVDDTKIQLARPASYQQTALDLMQTTDMTASACALTLDTGGEFHVLVLYPEDIHNRICRVIDNHEWTWYRAKSYKEKGYAIVYLEESQSKTKENE